MAEEQRSTDGMSDIDIKGPGGMGVNFRGSNQLMMVVIVVLVAVGGLGFYVQQHEAAAQTRAVDGAKRDAQASADVRNLTEAIAKQEKKLDAVIYVLTLTDAERKGLRLNKPEALRDMQR